MRKNCSSDGEELLKFEAEGREFAIFGDRCFFNLFLEVSHSNSNWNKLLGFKNMQEKLEKNIEVEIHSFSQVCLL